MCSSTLVHLTISVYKQKSKHNHHYNETASKLHTTADGQKWSPHLMHFKQIIQMHTGKEMEIWLS